MFEDLLDRWKNRPRPIQEKVENLTAKVLKYAFAGAFCAGVVSVVVFKLFGG